MKYEQNYIQNVNTP